MQSEHPSNVADDSLSFDPAAHVVRSESAGLGRDSTHVERTDALASLRPASPVASTEPFRRVIEPHADPAPASPWERYEDLGSLAQGTMGEVRRVRDRYLGRELAMKLLHRHVALSVSARTRFLAEARLLARIDHPGIVPVYDCGIFPDGRPWFTTREAGGRTLRDDLEPLQNEMDPVLAASALRRVLDLYIHACDAIGHAHARGVIHRDLKPEDVLVVGSSAVLVTGWISARGSVDAPIAAAYLAPEQALGDVAQISPRSDVYALGAILYEILCGAPPFDPSNRALLAELREGPPPPVASRARHAPSRDFIAICERAMARRAEHRFADARALVDEMRLAFDGGHRRARALAQVDEANKMTPQIASLRERSQMLRRDARAWLTRLHAYDPVEKKADAWNLEDEARALDVAATLQEVAWHQTLRAALDEVPNLTPAHEALADAFASDLRSAEEARDIVSAARAESLLRLHDRGRHGALLRGEGTVTLHTDPPGAEVWAYRYSERGRRVVPEVHACLGTTPLRRVTLPRGSYVLCLRAPGYADTHYPIVIGRDEPWDGVRPGHAASEPVPLLREDSLGSDDVYVPAGWFVCGGDPAAVESLPRARVWVSGFVLRRHPVTVAEYLVYLNDLVARRREAEAIAACPRVAHSFAESGDVALFSRTSGGLFTLDREDIAFARGASARHPIVSIDWHTAAAYAAWESTRSGFPWRLVSELEREKAARGVDGRFMPWGDHVEPTWACMVGSRAGAARAATVDDYTSDESPYGARGLAGNIRDWCIDAWAPEGPAIEGGIAIAQGVSPVDSSKRSIRGGAFFAAPLMCRLAARFSAAPNEHFAGVGFRLARSIDGHSRRFGPRMV